MEWYLHLPILIDQKKNTNSLLKHANHNQTFTIGRGNELVCSAITLLAPLVQGKDLNDLTATGAKHGATSSPTANYAGSVPKRA